MNKGRKGSGVVFTSGVDVQTGENLMTFQAWATENTSEDAVTVAALMLGKTWAKHKGYILDDRNLQKLVENNLQPYYDETHLGRINTGRLTVVFSFANDSGPLQIGPFLTWAPNKTVMHNTDGSKNACHRFVLGWLMFRFRFDFWWRT